MKRKLLVTFLLYTGILAALAVGFQNCSSSNARFSEQAQVVQSSENSESVDPAAVVEPSLDLTNAKLTLKGVVRSGWRMYKAISSDPIAGVTIHVKVGARADAATKNNPDFRVITTDATGAFEFKDLPNNTYTLYWDVPAHYYHENDYAAEFKVTQLNEEKVISDNIWLHGHGYVYRCIYKDSLPMKNLNVRLYESTSVGSTTRANSSVLRSALTAEDGSFYLDTAHLTPGKSGVAELSDSNGNIVGKVALRQLDYQGLSGGGYCE